MSLFPSLDKELESEDKYLSPEKINLNIDTIQYRYDTILNSIKNGTMNKQTLETDIYHNLDKYLSYDNLNNSETRKLFQELWQNEQFLTAIYNVIRYIGIKNLSISNKICLTKIAYDYINEVRNQNKEIVNKFLEICDFIHHPDIVAMSAFIYIRDALQLCIARYSYFEEQVCVHRVTNTILRLNYDFSTNQIIGIMNQLFKGNDSFSELFRYSMSDTKFYLNSPRDYSLYNRINIALLTILNNKGMNEIINILISYSNYCTLSIVGEEKRKLRFSLHDQVLEKDYPNISEAIHRISEEYYVY